MAMNVIRTDGPSLVVVMAVLLALAFAGGYYYYREKDKDTVLDINIGGKNISATVDHE